MHKFNTYIGPAGTASKVTIEPNAKAAKTCLSAWFIHSTPEQHPFWNKYQLSVIHLRDVEDVKPALKKYHAAEYELNLYALNPEKDPQIHDVQSWQLLMPANMTWQFHGLNDEQAVTFAEKIARYCAEGILFVEPGGIQNAVGVWAKVLQKTVDDIRKGIE